MKYLLAAVTLLALGAADYCLTPDAIVTTERFTVEIKAVKRGQFHSNTVVGTGIIVGAHGRALTNWHVISGAESVTAVLDSGSEVPVTVSRHDEDADMAMLDLPDGAYVAAVFASRPPRVGDPVIVVGNPFGYHNTVTTGVISGLDRALLMRDGELHNLTQVSAPVNPGNSGGPVVNRRGEVIGMASAMRQDAQCMGFVIPASDLLRFVNR